MTQALPEARPQAWTPDDSSFGARLALLRQAMKWNMTEAAQECGLNRENWRLWEEGRLPRDLVTVGRAIAARTGCDVDWLVMGPSRAHLQRRMDVTPWYPDHATPASASDKMTLARQTRPTVGHTLRGPLPDVMALPSLGRPSLARVKASGQTRPSILTPA